MPTAISTLLVRRGHCPKDCSRAVCCGTHPGDWPQVLRLADRDDRVEPALGLHPWFLAAAEPGWEEILRDLLKQNPRASIGEIGLDRTRKSPPLDDQEVALRSQLALAVEFGRPITLHCVRAWGRLLGTLDDAVDPEWPVMLHSFAAPEEMIPQFLEREGVIFSFRTLPGIATLQKIPIERVVYESDAFSGAESSIDLDGARKAIDSAAALLGRSPSELSGLADLALDRFLERSPAA